MKDNKEIINALRVLKEYSQKDTNTFFSFMAQVMTHAYIDAVDSLGSDLGDLMDVSDVGAIRQVMETKQGKSYEVIVRECEGD